MIPPSRSTSERVLLTVGAHCLELSVDDGRQRLETPFEAATFDPRLPTADTRLNIVEARGELLWTAAFSGSLGLFVDQAAARAREQGSAVMLHVVPSRDLPVPLRSLPWEVLFDPQRRDFLSLKSGWSVVRGVDPFQAVRPLPADGLRVRVLVVSDSPEAVAEAETMTRVLSDRAAVEVIRVRTAEQLTGRLGGDAAVIHVIGPGLGEGLVMPEAEGYAGRRAIARAIAANERAGLVVFSGGLTAQVAEEVAKEASVTVLAHRTVVRDEHAVLLAETFYRRLLDGIPADVALTEARRAQDRKFPGERAWTSAVLFTGWPPLTVPRPAVVPGGTPQSVAAQLELDVNALKELLYTRNRDRARHLLAGADWQLVRDQLAEAEARLQGLPPRTP